MVDPVSAFRPPLRDVLHELLPNMQSWRLLPEAGHLVAVLHLAAQMLWHFDQRALDAIRTFLWVHGPLVVIHQRHNDVEARHLATGLVGTYHVSRLKLFVGDQAQARDAAMRDQDQYSIDVVLNYQGNPLRRSETRYYVRFKDSDTRWLTYTRDLFETVQFNDFVSTRPELSILNLPAASVSKFITYVKRKCGFKGKLPPTYT